MEFYQPSEFEQNPTRVAVPGPGRQSAVIGYVIIPPDVERQAFVAQCYATRTVAAFTDGGEFFPRIAVPRGLIELVEFPAEKGQVGSPLLLVDLPQHSEPVVAAVFATAEQVSEVLGEHRLSLVRRAGPGRYVGLSGNAGAGQLTLSVASPEPEPRLLLLVQSADSSGQFELQVRGQALVVADTTLRLHAGQRLELGVGEPDEKHLALTYQLGQGLNYNDEWDNSATAGEKGLRLAHGPSGRTLELSKDGISLGSAQKSAEPAVLGDQLGNILDRLVTAIEKMTVQTNVGPTYPGPVNLSEFEAIRDDIKKIKSSVVTLD